MTYEEFRAATYEVREAMLLAVRRRAATEEWFMKPTGGNRWGMTAEEGTLNQEVSRWLATQYPEPPAGSLVTDIRGINDWLRSHGVRVGGPYRVGDELAIGVLSVIIEIP